MLLSLPLDRVLGNREFDARAGVLWRKQDGLAVGRAGSAGRSIRDLAYRSIQSSQPRAPALSEMHVAAPDDAPKDRLGRTDGAIAVQHGADQLKMPNREGCGTKAPFPVPIIALFAALAQILARLP